MRTLAIRRTLWSLVLLVAVSGAGISAESPPVIDKVTGDAGSAALARQRTIAGWGAGVQVNRVVFRADETLRATALLWNSTPLDVIRVFPYGSPTLGCHLTWWVEDGYGNVAIRPPSVSCTTSLGAHILRAETKILLPFKVVLEYENSELGHEGSLDTGVYRLLVRWHDMTGPVPLGEAPPFTGTGNPGASIDFVVE